MAVWLAGTIGMAVVATVNFYSIDRLLQAQPNPAFARDIEKLGHDETRALLYYFSSELNRLYFQYWNVAQLAIGIAALWLITRIPGADTAKWEVVAMLAIVLFLTILITPRIVSVGRSIDFVPRVPPPEGLRTFGLLHATYTVFDGVGLILGILAVLSLQRLKD
jgi:hypothetical protein